MGESEVGIEAWYMDTLETDQRLPHRHVLAAGGYVIVMVLRREQWAIDNTAEQDTAEGYMTQQHTSGCGSRSPSTSVRAQPLERDPLLVSHQLIYRHRLCFSRSLSE